jgi:ribosome-binding factor A
MSGKNRPERVAQLIHEQVAALLVRGLKDPRVQNVTITGAKISPDLRQARVYWTIRGDELQKELAAKGLGTARGWLRREVAQTLGLRVAPDLHFTYDESIDRGMRIEGILQKLKREDARRKSEGEAGPTDGAAQETGPGSAPVAAPEAPKA